MSGSSEGSACLLLIGSFAFSPHPLCSMRSLRRRPMAGYRELIVEPELVTGEVSWWLIELLALTYIAVPVTVGVVLAGGEQGNEVSGNGRWRSRVLLPNHVPGITSGEQTGPARFACA